MHKNNIFIPLTLLGLLILQVFNLASANKYSSGKESKSCYRKDGKCNGTVEGASSLLERVTLKLNVEITNKDGVTARIKSDNENESDILSLSDGNINDNLDAQSDPKGSEKENSDIVGELSSNEPHGDEPEDMKRSLRAGDIFTPYELLPVTERLLAKVELQEGTGRGIVSGSKSPEDLADKIFAAYFLTTKRIIILKDVDIPGLDELQSLALTDDPTNSKYMVGPMTKVPKIEIRNPVLTKKESKKGRIAEHRNEKLRKRNIMLKLEKKMQKNRHLVVNSKSKKYKRGRRMQSFRKALLEPGCTWHYECREPYDLETCHLKAKCNNKTLSNGYMDEIITPSRKEVTMSENFRRAIGIDVIDEKVEKIIASHVLLVKPENLKKNINIESLDEYFNKLVIAHHAGTTPIAPMNLDNDKNTKDSNAEDTNSADSDSKGNNLYKQSEKAAATTKKSNLRNKPHIVKLLKTLPRLKQKTTTPV